MKKVNFKKLQVPNGIRGLREGDFSILDIAKSFGNELYMNSSGIPNRRLAEKIYDSEDEIELTDEEIQIIRMYINSSDKILLPFFDGIELAINKAIEDEKALATVTVDQSTTVNNKKNKK